MTLHDVPSLPTYNNIYFDSFVRIVHWFASDIK